MTKMMIAMAALMIAAPAGAQTTTCTSTMFNLPGQTGFECQTTQPQAAPTQQAQIIPWGAGNSDASLRQRELDLRERELRVREAEAGVAPAPKPSTGRRAMRAMFGF